MQRLNSQDALFVYGETKRWPLHMASLLICEPTDESGALDVSRVRELYRERLPHIPAYRLRLARVPAGLDRPVWVEAPDIDVDEHIDGVTLEPPGTLEQLGELVGRLHEPPLDLDRPPWQIWVIDGLEDGSVAVLSRVHHALLDGIRGMEVQAATFDVTADAPLARPGSLPGVGDRPSTLTLLGGAAAHLAAIPVRVTRTAGHLVGAAGRLAGVVRRNEVDGFTLPMTAPRTAFNRSITERRAFSFGSVPLPVVKRAARQEGVTVNDVVLALVGGALRRYLDEQGSLPERTLIAAVPVGLSSADGPATGTSGNHWEAMVTSLGSDVGDPLERIHAVARSSRAAKAVQSAIGDDLWTDLVDLPPALVRVLSHGYAGLRLADLHPALVNVVVSNVRGAPFPLYYAGASLRANYPVGPIADGFGLNVTLISYQDSVDFGFTSCPDLVEQPWRLVEALHAEVAALAGRCPEAAADG